MSTLNIPDIKKHSEWYKSRNSCCTRDENDQHHLIWIGEVKGDKVVLIKISEEVKQQWHAI
ncbi:hypothetical protein [Acinetobacter johnsonii]|uniref:hypothetical protein n=1 Tax=Acinetobacter johnsonii TaxID=40214 RepID=UPI00376F183E